MVRRLAFQSPMRARIVTNKAPGERSVKVSPNKPTV